MKNHLWKIIIEHLIEYLQKQKCEKIKAICILENFLNTAREEIYYEYIRGNIPQHASSASMVKYYFHGNDCHVTDGVINAQIEFGPKGETLGFDKYNLCYPLNKKIQKINLLISTLVSTSKVKIIDDDLYKLSQNKHMGIILSDLSVEEQIDLVIADRYILI